MDAASPLSRRSKQQLKKRRVLGSIDDEAAARFNSYSPSPVVQISTTGSNPARSVVPLRGVHDGLLLFSVGPAIWKYTTLGLPIEPVLAAAAMTNGGGGGLFLVYFMKSLNKKAAPRSYNSFSPIS